MIKQIPNALTLLNVFCGSCALVSIQNGRYTEGVIFLIVALVADFFDGFAARLLNVKSDMGRELDSLADMVSFGVVPGLILYKLIKISDLASSFEHSYLPLAAFVITAFSCYRLAKFNLDTRQTTDFIGLATPANTLFFIGLLLIKKNELEGLKKPRLETLGKTANLDSLAFRKKGDFVGLWLIKFSKREVVRLADPKHLRKLSEK